ncbi:BRO family protein [Escherichia coli]|uniref:BRO-N domain-containing protein n=1 Tax=Escherichia coli TaxID=562 RepID=UPI0030055390
MRKPVFYAGRTEISVIKFDDIQVRIVSINGEPWFVGADVCAALEISNVTDAVSVLDNDEVMTLAVTNGAIVIHTQRLKSDPGGNLLS